MAPTNPMSFKAANYKGMDLSFGSKVTNLKGKDDCAKINGNIFGGILIRALYDLQND